MNSLSLDPPCILVSFVWNQEPSWEQLFLVLPPKYKRLKLTVCLTVSENTVKLSQITDSLPYSETKNNI